MQPNNNARFIFILLLFLFLLGLHSWNQVYSKERPHFVLVLYSDSSYNNATYVGTFYSCAVAHRWIQLHFANPWIASRCLHEEYMNLPVGFEHRYIDLIDMTELRRKRR